MKIDACKEFNISRWYNHQISDQITIFHQHPQNVCFLSGLLFKSDAIQNCNRIHKNKKDKLSSEITQSQNKEMHKHMFLVWLTFNLSHFHQITREEVSKLDKMKVIFYMSKRNLWSSNVQIAFTCFVLMTITKFCVLYNDFEYCNFSIETK